MAFMSTTTEIAEHKHPMPIESKLDSKLKSMEQDSSLQKASEEKKTSKELGNNKSRINDNSIGY